MSDERKNVMQRVWDAFPEYPGIITFDGLHALLPNLSRATIVAAVKRLTGQPRAYAVRYVELVRPSNGAVYRRVKGASRPIDMRGHHGNGGRPRNEKAAA
ncbi:MAG TPA: hypothetical protein VJQ42_02120 [Rhodanobacteraceae bacterium]|nr:hypothetical protein [Rhodanobacteraceae bacterium]